MYSLSSKKKSTADQSVVQSQKYKHGEKNQFDPSL